MQFDVGPNLGWVGWNDYSRGAVTGAVPSVVPPRATGRVAPGRDKTGRDSSARGSGSDPSFIRASGKRL
jgi:hypothetical protein